MRDANQIRNVLVRPNRNDYVLSSYYIIRKVFFFFAFCVVRRLNRIFLCPNAPSSCTFFIGLIVINARYLTQ